MVKYVSAALLLLVGGGILIALNRKFNVAPVAIDGDPDKGMDYTRARWPKIDDWVTRRLKPILP